MGRRAGDAGLDSLPLSEARGASAPGRGRAGPSGLSLLALSCIASLPAFVVVEAWPFLVAIIDRIISSSSSSSASSAVTRAAPAGDANQFADGPPRPPPTDRRPGPPGEDPPASSRTSTCTSSSESSNESGTLYPVCAFRARSSSGSR